MAAHIYDLSLPPEALKTAARWATMGVGPVDIILTRVGDKLHIRQGAGGPHRTEWLEADLEDVGGTREIGVTVDSLAAAADWAAEGPGFGEVFLLVDDAMLLVYQGDDMAGFDTDGSAASEEYLAVAPLDR